MKSKNKALCFLALIIMIVSFNPSAKASDLTLQLQTFDGSRHIHMGQVKNIADDGSPVIGQLTKEIRLVATNAGTGRYKITQNFNRPLSNEQGILFDLSQIKCHVFIESGNGINRIASPTTLQMGEQELFLSNQNGENAQLIVVYEISVPAFKTAGNYLTSLTYRMQSI